MILRVLKRFNEDLTQLSSETGINKFWYYADALLCHLIHGASPNDYVLCGMYRASFLERFSFLTMRRAEKVERIFNPPKIRPLFDEKPKFNDLFRSFVKRGYIYCVDEDNYDDIVEFIKNHDYIIIKPTNLSSGRGVEKIKTSLIDDLSSFVKTAIEKKLLIEECIQQREDLKRLNPHSVNTLRIYTIKDRKSQVIHVLGGGLRIGTTTSPVDNMHDNGIYYPIDVKTGIIMHRGMDIKGKRYIYHPTINEKMLGMQILDWDKVILFVKAASEVVPEARYIGWDVALTESGCEMIEGNVKAYIGDLQKYEIKGIYKEIMKYR
ncbi:MAG: hypothetical protein IJZ38_02535 [Bacteroides sp.]|nr:hypothetical protein [Bacteroides sp.]